MRLSQVRTFTPNFTVVALKMWAYIPKIAQIGNFWYKICPKGVYPWSDFTKFGMEEGVWDPHPHAKFHPRSFTNVCKPVGNKASSSKSYSV